MSMQDYEEALRLLPDNLEATEFEPQPEERVRRAEAVLGVQFPPTYRRFVSELGAGGVGSEEIYGVFNDDLEDFRPPQAVGLTLKLRREGAISDDLIVVYNLGQGSYFALDTSKAGPDGEAPVVSFTPGLNVAGDHLDEIASDFGAFFLDDVRVREE